MLDAGQHKRELWATVLLSVATLLTAWSAFQATKWGGLMSIRFSEANAARTESASAAAKANSQRSLDVTVFTSYIEAVAAERTEQQEFIVARFRDEFRPAFDAWAQEQPRSNPSAPPTPFVMPEYKLAEEQRSAELSALADRRGEQARDANQQGDDYVLLTVIFASVLFFSGIATKLTSRGPQIATLTFASALILTAFAIGLTFPIEV